MSDQADNQNSPRHSTINSLTRSISPKDLETKNKVGFGRHLSKIFDKKSIKRYFLDVCFI